MFRLPSTGALLMAAIPFAAMCFSVSLWDRVHPFILDLPFNIFWLCLWTLLSPLCILSAYKLEKARLEKREGQHE